MWALSYGLGEEFYDTVRKMDGNAPKRRMMRITPAPVSGLSKRDVRLIENADVLREIL